MSQPSFSLVNILALPPAVLRYGITALLCALLAITACSGKGSSGKAAARPLVRDNLDASAHPRFSPLRYNEIAVMPLTVDHSLRGMPPADLDQLTARLEDSFMLHTSLELLNRRHPQKLQAATEASENHQGPIFTRAAKFGTQLGAQAVLCGVINRYVRRSGGTLGADQAAEAQFRLWLVDVATAEPLWQASYDNHSQTLSENLFRLPSAVQEGVKYRSALELMERGFASAAKDLERLRKAASDGGSGREETKG